MEFKRQIENLHKDIQDIEKLITSIKDYDSISAVDVDLLKSKIQHAYEGLLMIHIDTAIPEVQDGFDRPADVKEPSDHAPEAVSEPSGIEEKELPEPIQKTDDIQDDPVREAPSKPNKSKHKEVLADRYIDKKQFRNEHLVKDQKVRDLTSKFDSQPLSDISDAIGVNDKFQYIKELFKGDGEKFMETIDFLNEVNSEEEAANYLEENFSLDIEDPLVMRLLNLARRKLKIKDHG